MSKESEFERKRKTQNQVIEIGLERTRGSSSLDALQHSLAILTETENVAKDTLNNLHQQKGQIKRMITDTEKINSELSFSQKVLARMSKLKWWS